MNKTYWWKIIDNVKWYIVALLTISIFILAYSLTNHIEKTQTSNISAYPVKILDSVHVYCKEIDEENRVAYNCVYSMGQKAYDEYYLSDETSYGIVK